MTGAKKMVVTLSAAIVCLTLAGCGKQVAQFHEAVSTADFETAYTLLEQSPKLVNTQKDGYTPLFRAIDQQQKDMVVMLVQNGADINATNETGSTPLHVVAEQGLSNIA
jgi:ankyrin repeat protein